MPQPAKQLDSRERVRLRPSIEADRLLAELRAGRSPALAAVYEAYRRDVYVAALSVTGQPAESEDIVQDVFAELPRAIRTFEGRSSLLTWLRRVAVFRAKAYVRSRQRKREVPLGAEPTGDGSGSASVLDRLALERAIAELPLGYRAVLVLKDVEGWPHEEIASELGITLSSSYMRLSRARRMLRDKLRP